MRVIEYWGQITSHKCLVIRAREENESGKSERKTERERETERQRKRE